MGSGHGITGGITQFKGFLAQFTTKPEEFSLLDEESFNSAIKSISELNEETKDNGLKNYLSTVKDGSATFKGYKAYVESANAANKAMSVSSRLASVGVKVLNVTLNAMVSMGIGLALNFILEGISNLANASKEAAENAKEAAEELNESISSLDSYKQKIAELNEELASGNLSQAEAYEKRKELLAIQDELISKYGSEKDAINSITAAIGGEVDALDELTKKEAQDWLNENQGAYGKAQTHMTEEVEAFEQWGTAGGGSSEERQMLFKHLEEAIKEAGGNSNLVGFGKALGFNFSYEAANRKELKNFYDEVFVALDEFEKQNPNSDIDMQYFKNRTSSALKYWIDENHNTNKSIFEEGGRYEAIVNYSDEYNKLNKAKAKFENALAMGDENSANKALLSIRKIKEEIAGITNMELGAKNYFDTFLTDFETASANNYFEIDFEANEDGLKDKVTNALEKIKKSLGNDVTKDGILGIEDLVKLGDVNAIMKLNVPYQDLVKIADESNMSIEQLLILLTELGLVEEEASEKTDTFADVLSSKSESIETTQSKVAKLKETLQALNNGELTSSDVTSLMSEFPELIPYIDLTAQGFGKLGAGLNSLIDSNIGDLTSELEAFRDSLTTEEDKQQLDDLIDSLNNLSKTGSVDISVSGISGELNDISSAYSTLYSAIQEYNNSGILSINTMQSLLSLEPQYLSLLMDENGQLQLNEEAFYSLAKARLEDLKVAHAQQLVNQLYNLGDEAAAMDYYNSMMVSNTALIKDNTAALFANAKAEMAKRDAQAGDGSTVYTDAYEAAYKSYLDYASVVDSTSASLSSNMQATLGVTAATESNTDATNAQKTALENLKETQEAEKRQLEDLKKAYEDQKKSMESATSEIEDLIKHTVDMLKEQYDAEIDGIEKTKDAYKEKIDLMKEALDVEKDTEDYRRSIESKNKDIASIQQQLASARSSGNLSRAAELEDQLSEKQQDLADTQYDHSIEVQKEALDNEYSRKEELWNREIERVKEVVGNERMLRLEAMALIDARSQEFYNNLSAYIYEHTIMSEFAFQQMWDKAYIALDKYNFGHYTTFEVMTFLEQEIDILDGKINETEIAIEDVSIAIENTSEQINSLSDSINNYADSIRNLNAAANNTEVEVPDNNNDSNDSKPSNSSETKKKTNKLPDYEIYINGIRYIASSDTESGAAQQIAVQYAELSGISVSSARRKVLKNITRVSSYSTGTKSTKGNLIRVDENGKDEIIFDNVNGRLRLANENSWVFNNGMVENLWSAGENPAKFVAENASLITNNVTKTPAVNIGTIAVDIKANDISEKSAKKFAPLIVNELYAELKKTGSYFG